VTVLALLRELMRDNAVEQVCVRVRAACHVVDVLNTMRTRRDWCACDSRCCCGFCCVACHRHCSTSTHSRRCSNSSTLPREFVGAHCVRGWPDQIDSDELADDLAAAVLLDLRLWVLTPVDVQTALMHLIGEVYRVRPTLASRFGVRALLESLRYVYWHTAATSARTTSIDATTTTTTTTTNSSSSSSSSSSSVPRVASVSEFVIVPRSSSHDASMSSSTAALASDVVPQFGAAARTHPVTRTVVGRRPAPADVAQLRAFL
jgi:hypothetical protein